MGGGAYPFFETPEAAMGERNRYCTRCGKTTRFRVVREVYTCAGCGVSVVIQSAPAEGRVLWGDPFAFRVRFN
jgi:hypothetical protein